MGAALFVSWLCFPEPSAAGAATPPGRDIDVLLPAQPADSDLRNLPLWPRRLLPVDVPPAAHGLGKFLAAAPAPKSVTERQSENAEAAVSLRAILAPGSANRLASLDAFLAAHPRSRWAPALRLERGHEQFKRGFFNKAVADWDQLWQDHRDSREAGAVAVADEALARLLEVNMGRGDAPRLAQLLGDAESRPGNGALEPIIWRAKKSAWLLQHIPAQTMMCGPLALYAILQSRQKPFTPLVLNDETISDVSGVGISLDQVRRYADGFGMHLRAAKRGGVGPVPVPAVMHHRAGHYSAILGARDGLYFFEDRPMRFTGWVSEAALAEMQSGYYLIPDDRLPDGWSAIAAAEAATVFGKDGAHGQAPTRQSTTVNTPEVGGKKNPCGMPGYSFHPQVASLRVDDTPLGYAPPVGPAVGFMLSYNDNDDSKPVSAPNYPNVGRLWNVWWVSFVDHVPGNLINGMTVTVYLSGGGAEVSSYNSATGLFGPNDQSFATVRRYGAASNAYERVLPDGTREIFAAPDDPLSPTRIFLSQRIAPQGNAMTFAYDGSMRLNNVVDTIGQVTTLSYTNDDPFKITSVTDPFGRSCAMTYGDDGELASVVDAIGLSSSFLYDGAQFMTNMTTPYGTTAIVKSTGPNAWDRTLTITDPEGGRERVTYTEPITVPPGFSGTTPPTNIVVGSSNVAFYAENVRMQYRNSFYWDKRAMREAPDDILRARNYRWYTDANYRVCPVMESMKDPLTERVWFNYPGSSTTPEGFPAYLGGGQQPSKTLQWVNGGNTIQLWQHYYNVLGKPTTLVDPLGRVTEYVYAGNNVDLLQIRQRVGSSNDILSRFTYNAQHLPLTMTNAAGEGTTLRYNARGQVTNIVNALGEVTAYFYDSNGYLLRIDGPLAGTNDSITQTWDASGHVATQTSPDGYTLAFSYDDFDRLTRIDYPDGTYGEFTYNRLDMVSVRDRLGRVMTTTRDSLQRITSAQDALGRVTRYSWCSCGSLEQEIDPLGQVTRWEYDLQNRLTAKISPDGTRVRYEYENLGNRLANVTDERGQVKSFTYNVDNSLQKVDYVNAVEPTPSVTYSYDTAYLRMTQIVDGVGATLITYVPVTGGINPGAREIASLDGPWSNDTVAFQYDALGRIASRTVGGVPMTMAYDSLSRVISVTNALGAFAYAWDGPMGRTTSATYPNGQSVLYSYYGGTQDRRLREILNRRPDTSPLSRFTYAYDTAGQITNWTQVADSGAPLSQAFTYDAANQLLSAVSKTGASVVVASCAYAYDVAGNRTLEQIDGTNRTFAYNALNQMAGAVPDLNVTSTNAWDARQRLVRSRRGALETRYEFNGFGQRVRVTDIAGGVTNRDVRYVWANNAVVEERAADGSNVLKRFFPGGVQILSGPVTGSFFYARDHLDSVREVLDSSGALRRRYTYDAWGRRTAIAGTLDTDMGFSGILTHPTSGDGLTLHRVYDPDLGRWLSRDPLGEAAGLNLYQYVGNNPVNEMDPFGLESGGGPVGWENIEWDHEIYLKERAENPVTAAQDAERRDCYSRMVMNTPEFKKKMRDQDEYFKKEAAAFVAKEMDFRTMVLSSKEDMAIYQASGLYLAPLLGPIAERAGITGVELQQIKADDQRLLDLAMEHPENKGKDRKEVELFLYEQSQRQLHPKEKALDTNFEIQAPTPTASVRG